MKKLLKMSSIFIPSSRVEGVMCLINWGQSMKLGLLPVNQLLFSKSSIQNSFTGRLIPLTGGGAQISTSVNSPQGVQPASKALFLINYADGH